MIEIAFPYIFNGIMSFMATGLSFRAWVLPYLDRNKAESTFIKKELLLLRDSHTKLKQEFYDFKAETMQNHSELANNDSAISKRQDAFEQKMDLLIAGNERIDNHFGQMIEILKERSI